MRPEQTSQKDGLITYGATKTGERNKSGKAIEDQLENCPVARPTDGETHVENLEEGTSLEKKMTSQAPAWRESL